MILLSDFGKQPSLMTIVKRHKTPENAKIPDKMKIKLKMTIIKSTIICNKL